MVPVFFWLGCAVLPYPSAEAEAEDVPLAAPPWLSPTLADIPAEADAALGVVDRATRLTGAVDPADAPVGAAPDLLAVPRWFSLADATELDGVGTAAVDPDANAVHAADLLSLLRSRSDGLLAGPRDTVETWATAPLTELGGNRWGATLATEDDGVVLAVAAWVGTGWLLETGDWDGSADPAALTMVGFLLGDGQLGWWDLIEAGELAAAAEWAGSDEGSGALGVTALRGGAAGTDWTWDVASDHAHLGFHLPWSEEPYWVLRRAPGEGQLRDPGYAGGDAVCWDAAEVDVSCEGDGE